MKEDLYLLDGATQDTVVQVACKGAISLFFGPELTERKVQRITRESKAKAICQTCVYIDRCRELGRQNDEVGVWGGETERERRRSRRYL